MDKAAVFGTADGGSIPSRGASRAHSSMVEQFPLKESVGGSNPPALTNMWFIYIIQCADSTYYTGITTNVVRRINEHNTKNSIGSKYTRIRRPVTLRYLEQSDTRSSASKREYVIKHLSRQAKIQLMQSANKST